MSKWRLKYLLTLVYSVAIAAVFCLVAYLISQRINFNLKETYFLIGLVAVLAGILIIIAKNQSRVTVSDIVEQNMEEDEPGKEGAGILLGLNGFTLVLSGVFLLVIDAVIR
ncbi:hypothetical protein CLHUN_19670 [Ruminiclostridium hungatei]|uniref:Uncharacterized protein n=1 Tax=Ruminiclostridium hungatei TaxID=48256 RepID=A0A1V4SJV8_RUMHU|nr:hypothetical protein [Ruminiclostridium hungatei]OPX44168.1 hypothetical protein CLHUN_19670 [Ruminiclostridium hungatei]